MALLYHATTRSNLESIREHGLLVSKADSKAKIKGCWLHTRSMSPWGCLHTIRKHKARLEDVVILEVSVPRSWLTRFRTGLWYSKRDIPVERIGRVIEGTEFSASVSE